MWRLRHTLKGLNSVYVIKLKFIIKAVFGLALLYIRPPPPPTSHPHSQLSCFLLSLPAHTHTRTHTEGGCACCCLMQTSFQVLRPHKQNVYTHKHTQTDMDNIHMKVGNGHKRSGSAASGKGWMEGGWSGFKVFDCVAFARFAASV